MSHLATTAIGALLPHQADHERQHGIDLAGSRSRRQRTTLCARRKASAVMSGFSPRAALRKSRCGMSLEARWPPCPTGSREPWRSRRSSHFDGHGFADLVLTPRRPAAQLAPLHRVDHRTLARSPIRDPLHRRLQPFCYLHDCSGCFRLERLPSGPCTHCKVPPYSRRTRRADVADSAVAAGGKRSTALNAIERLPHAAQSCPSDRQAQRSAEVVDELFSHWQARNSVWAVVLQWTLAVSSALHWLWSSTSWARQGISLFATSAAQCNVSRYAIRSARLASSFRPA